jgi:DNA-binding NarL/FixJ family response regulator
MDIRKIYDEITATVENSKSVESPEWQRPLTPREVQILQLASEGKGNKQIAIELNISPLTVKSHFARMATALGTGKREVMVFMALRAGVIK